MNPNVLVSNENWNPTTAAATPLIVLPDMSQADIDAAWDDMIRRSKATDEFLAGEIGFSEFSEYLDHDEIDVEDYLEAWSENLNLLYECA